MFQVSHNLRSSSEDDDRQSPFPKELSLQQVHTHTCIYMYFQIVIYCSYSVMVVTIIQFCFLCVLSFRHSQTTRSSRSLLTLWISLASMTTSSQNTATTSSKTQTHTQRQVSPLSGSDLTVIVCMLCAAVPPLTGSQRLTSTWTQRTL